MRNTILFCAQFLVIVDEDYCNGPSLVTETHKCLHIMFIHHQSFWKCFVYTFELFSKKILSDQFLFYFWFSKVSSVLTNLLKQETSTVPILLLFFNKNVSTVAIYGLNLCIQKGSNKILQDNIFRSWFEFLLLVSKYSQNKVSINIQCLDIQIQFLHYFFTKLYHINSLKHKQKRDLFLQLLFPIRLVSL